MFMLAETAGEWREGTRGLLYMALAVIGAIALVVWWLRR
jgi:hypothetical protein